ncbi:MAG: phosphoribosylformylglycinamidine cyclo-ligase [Omnitrophica bacterium RIFCSPLOWO2_12_FULL_44_17]|uniref:Phosphoribosylformylglycinamidine cyclo-ligase n=1 Tax=Candidatus Danuiimicrobium aquiferis TaxID=1801832 RepID=A0A1G1KW92_9BACT|nr:MAG: phosphoribosylformylglycinamidine cyclo-ligase [Omnitrophica bacterium RIFCSPHIGHO2_02_FULL_45_28]OGW90267.1 MAG: phosphoribosylformylglycinamidine cyclo-ligase [Omnitrophica bacterium RIFCSPHIGHO2_12_FULL_44_12]OGW97244.1 MAG: phosphoribosylformylglycinamidine cyclo-ligase [Omnitrophica bacterium RIFCSPLOWO2_12_FULL_44_17]OGX02299.1 MAG: phosphoribosylformylglycinamidine cyclo-ligase [Omnitrophica bacterium RIFCSPLOWO2_02_FULL_44_11]
MGTGNKKLESYAGVPHLKGDPKYNRLLAQIVNSTRDEASGSFGGFSACYDLKKFKLKHPILVSSTDGVGTKLDLARILNKHDTIGIDLVAMSANDLVTCGAQPVLFLDYFATGKFDQRQAVEVIRGIAKGCRESGCALLGGETAIMPGFYEGSKYDLAGFSVGLVERADIIDGKKVRAGHVLLGLESSGFHSNGYSLLRKVFSKKELSGSIGRKLLVPTRLYVKPVLSLINSVDVKAIAHITGGGMVDNLPRVLPKGLGARINKGSWPVAPLFAEVAKRARYTEHQMFHTFNMGIGLVVVIQTADVKRAQDVLKKFRICSWEIGLVDRSGKVIIE